jgi:nucleoside-diphosphate kinase
MERTFAIIKPTPSSAARGTDPGAHRGGGFTVRAMRLQHLTKTEAEGFYAVHRERPFFGELTDFMSSGPCVLLALERRTRSRSGATRWAPTDPAKATPGTLRRDFGESIGRNATHGSDAPETAAFELGYFFRGWSWSSGSAWLSSLGMRWDARSSLGC